MTKETGNRVLLIPDEKAARREMAAAGVSQDGMERIVKKAVFCCLKIKDVSLNSANILKQEMLSRGGEAAVSAKAADAYDTTDMMLMGTHLQLSDLADRLLRQPLDLNWVAESIQEMLNALHPRDYLLPLPDGKTLALSHNRTQIMGIVNVTPDSFSDGGLYLRPEEAVKQALRLREEGADLIDLGAVSSRPGAGLADAGEEWRRLQPVVEALVREDMILSVDTFRAGVAERALNAGAHIINDIGGFRMDTRLASVVAAVGCPVIMMHNRMQVLQDKPYTDFLSDVIKDLEESRNIGYQAGVKPEQIIVDPGVGFGKTPAQNRLLVKELAAFKGLGRPILLGLSRKSFIADTLPLAPQERDNASLALGIAGALNGAHILRVHEVFKTKQAMTIIDEMRNENG